MTSTRDIQDMLGVDADAMGRHQKSRKKSKVPGVKRPEGVSREMHSLMGERAAPLVIADSSSMFKAKRKTMKEDAARWTWHPFKVTPRADDLILRHWRKETRQPPVAGEQDDEADLAAGDEMTELDPEVLKSRNKSMARMERHARERQVESQQKPLDEEYKFAKYNVKIEEPSYDDELYDKYLNNTDWTKEETDYLFNLHRESWGKWHVIADRFDFSPSQSGLGSEDELSAPTHAEGERRDLDALKSRYYDVCAKVMAARTPLSNMNSSEFTNHEKMTKFSATSERERKIKKQALLTRSKHEAEEERLLVAELERMYKRQTEQEKELADLRDRLDYSLSQDLPGAARYTTSAEIGGLLQKLFQKDKTARMQQQQRLREQGLASSPHGPNMGVGPSGQGNKRASIVSSTPARQNMSAESEQRFGIKVLDKTVSGVTFKSDKLLKARQLKSAAKTQSLGVILLELGIPEIVTLPTDEVGRNLEILVSRVNQLIDRRNSVGKEENDLRVEREKRATESGGSALGGAQRGADVGADADDGEQGEENEDDDDDDDDDAEGDEDDAEGDQDVEMMDTNDAAGDGDDEMEESTEVKDEPTEVGDQDEDEEDDDDEDGEGDPEEEDVPEPSRETRGSKRSASVLSVSSTGSASRATSKRRRE